ncbi:MAG: phosphatase PAP2 family protein [Acidimicrobiales bacterium]
MNRDAAQLHAGEVRLRWYREVALVLGFYAVYSVIRNTFGSAAVSPAVALDNALTVIRVEQRLGLWIEPALQGLFVSWRAFIQFWNLFYGTFHFVVTGGVMVLLYRRHPARYPTWRNTLAFTTAFALIGFSAFPLMPPRLLGDFGPFGGGVLQFGFVDTLETAGGLWSFDSSAMHSISNQYAAMPSLHFAWASWCLFATWPTLKRAWSKALMALYPWATFFAILVTANHYWLDALGGAVILAVGWFCGSQLARWVVRRRAPSEHAAVPA